VQKKGRKAPHPITGGKNGFGDTKANREACNERAMEQDGLGNSCAGHNVECAVIDVLRRGDALVTVEPLSTNKLNGSLPEYI
jgi:hypothetical protein